MTEEHRIAGRPLAYEELGPDFVDATVMKLAREGRSIAEWAAELGVARSTIDYWRDNVPRFSEVFTRARAAEQAWWERTGRENLNAERFQQSVWGRTMSARFRHDYAETSRHIHANVADIRGLSDDALDERINELLGKAGVIDPKTQRVGLVKNVDLTKLTDEQLANIERALVALEQSDPASAPCDSVTGADQ